MRSDSVSPVLITGIGKRLGLALAQHFLIQDIPVIGTFRTHYPVLSELKLSGAELYQCDFYDQESVNAFIHSIKAKYPALRAIIHNASDWMPESVDREPADVMAKMMQVHVSVPYQINLAMQGLLLSSPENLKDIIHFTDFVADKGSKKHIAYAATKAALANMTLSFAAAFAPEVKVNSIAPALVLFNEHDSDDYKAKAVKKALIEKEGGLQEVITAVDYLFSSTYVTGRTLHLDGGRHLK